MPCGCASSQNDPQNEALIIMGVTEYDPKIHRRPADFHETLEDLEDDDLEPTSREATYRAWIKPTRPSAYAATPKLVLDGTFTPSFDMNFGIVKGVRINGSMCVPTDPCACPREP